MSNLWNGNAFNVQRNDLKILLKTIMNMKTIKTTYLTPECVSMDLTPEGVLCNSSDTGDTGYTILDFEFEKGSWE